MNRQYYCLFVVLFFVVFARAAAAEHTYNILFIQSYTSQTPWHNDLNEGLTKGFKENGLKVNITTEYLDADFWLFSSEKVIMQRFCQRARDRKTDMIITASDEAFYTLFSSGDSLPYQVPVVFFGIKYPDKELIASLPNVCGFTANPDFYVILKQAQKVFPQRKEVICVIDNSFLSNKGREDFKQEWQLFQEENPDYKMKLYNTQHESTNHIIAAIYDYKQLDFFHIDPDKVSSSGSVVNQPYWERYKLLFILLYPSILALLIVSIVWLIRVNRREAKRRIHAQTRLLVQNKLVEQRNEFDNIFHSIRDGVITYDTDLHIHFTNRSLLKILHLPSESGGRNYEGMMAGSIFKIYYNGQDILYKILKKVGETGQSVIIPDGAFMKEVHSEHYFPVSGEVVPIHSGGQITGMALSARNVSDEEMQKRFFDMAVEESSIYPWQFDVESNSFIFPQGFLVRFGYDESITSITRDEMDRMVYPEDLKEMRILFDKTLAGKETNTRLNFRQRNANGEYEWWEYRSSVISGLTRDSLYNILGVCQSIQRYKTAEQEMREARDKALQADKLKSAFLANMSHEIRTPLNAIVGFSDLLSDTSGFTEEEIGQFIATINKNCGLLLALINDILDLSRIESGTMEFMFANHNLPLLLKTVHDSQQLNMPPRVELLLRMPDNEKKYLVTDNVRLQQVVNNLINNAAKFTTYGSITFGYEEDEDPEYTRIFVEDTGVGISEEGIRHIFERFYKVDNFTQGAGLGLSICQTIVERLRGTIFVTSEVGRGTRFTVRIPNFCE